MEPFDALIKKIRVGPGFSPDSEHLRQQVRADAGTLYASGTGPG